MVYGVVTKPTKRAYPILPTTTVSLEYFKDHLLKRSKPDPNLSQSPNGGVAGVLAGPISRGADSMDIAI